MILIYLFSTEKIFPHTIQFCWLVTIIEMVIFKFKLRLKARDCHDKKK